MVSGLCDVPAADIKGHYKLGGKELQIAQTVGMAEFAELGHLIQMVCDVKIPEDEVRMKSQNLPETTVDELIAYVEGLAK
ncbi:MAG TPA: hypothetical protein VK145_03045 [Candidatus Nanoarchaeia archaeon]|nr:hypothetical protein [Candidatus Nanoarchaeia archaeon]